MRYEQHECCAELHISWTAWKRLPRDDREEMLAARRLRLRMAEAQRADYKRKRATDEALGVPRGGARVLSDDEAARLLGKL